MLSPVKIWRRQKNVRKLLDKKGRVISWTRIYTPPVGFKKNAPYVVVLVEFHDGHKTIGQLIDCNTERIRIGMGVLSVLRRVREVDQDDVIAYGLKFKPYKYSNE